MENVRKIFLTFLMAIVMTTLAVAQPNAKFDPVKFKADLEKFVTAEAHLTPSEAKQFFPLYHEMFQKQRALYQRMGELKRERPATDEMCKSVIQEMDRLTIEIDELQVTYHNKFFNILKPQKVFDVIQAISTFHRKAMREAGKRR